MQFLKDGIFPSVFIGFKNEKPDSTDEIPVYRSMLAVYNTPI